MTSLLELPLETISLILLSLPVRSILNCASACKKFRFVVNEDYIWRKLCETVHGMDTRALGNTYNTKWKQAYRKGPWINLENKRYIRKTIEKAKASGHCIELTDYNEHLMLNHTIHFSSSYSPSKTIAVGLADSNNFTNVKKIDFDDAHFKLIGDYLLGFSMDQLSCIYPSGITTNDFTVFKFDPNNLPKSESEALFKVSAKSAQYAPEPKFFVNEANPHLIYYASNLSAPSQRQVDGPYLVEIFDLTHGATPIRKQKMRGDAYVFGGKYIAWSKTGNPDKTIHLINWRDLTTAGEFSDDTGMFKFDNNVKELKHGEIVKAVFFHDDLVACDEKSGHLTIWQVTDEVKIVKRIDLKEIAKHAGCSVTHFDGTLVWLLFNPNGASSVRNSCAVFDWQTEKEINVTISTKELYFRASPMFTKNGAFSGKMILTQPSGTDILYLSTPYLAKKFDVAILTTEKDIIRGKRETTIYGNLAEDCRTLLGITDMSLLTSQVIFSNGNVRYVLLWEEHKSAEDEKDGKEKPKSNQLTELLHLTVLSRHENSPYGGIEFSGLDTNKQNPSMRRRVEVKLKNLVIASSCVLLKEELTADFGWVPCNLEVNLTEVLADLTQQMRTKYNVYHGFA